MLTAFQNVADTLHALYQDADALKAAAASRDAASVTLELSKKQYRAGYASYLSLLKSGTSISASPDYRGSGTGQPLCRYGCFVSGPGRRVVEPPGCS